MVVVGNLKSQRGGADNEGYMDQYNHNDDQNVNRNASCTHSQNHSYSGDSDPLNGPRPHSHHPDYDLIYENEEEDSVFSNPHHHHQQQHEFQQYQADQDAYRYHHYSHQYSQQRLDSYQPLMQSHSKNASAGLHLSSSSSSSSLHYQPPSSSIPPSCLDRFKRWMSLAGIGLVVMLADTDAGCLVTAGQTGAAWGYSFIPLQILLIPVVYVAQELTIRLGLFTGCGLTELIAIRFGRRVCYLVCFFIMVICAAALASEISGIVGVCQLEALPFRLSSFAGISISVCLLFGIAMLGVVYKLWWFEKTALCLGLFELVFLLTMAKSNPSLAELLEGMSYLPYAHHAKEEGVSDGSSTSGEQENQYWYMVAANIGAVIMPWMLFYQQSAVARSDMKVSDLYYVRMDTFVGSILTQLIMISVIVTSAATLWKGGYPDDIQVESVSDLGKALTPHLGRTYGGIFYGLGMFGGAMIGGLVVTMTAAWVLSEASQDFENLNSHSTSRLKCGDWGPGGEECSGDRGGSQRPTPAHGNGNGFINRYLYSVYDDESDNDNARDTHSCTHSDGSGYGHGRVDVDVDVNADAGGHRDGDSKRQRTIGGDSGRNNNVNNNSNTSNNSNSSNRNATPSTASRTPHVAQTSQRRIRHQVDEDGGKKTTTNSTFFALFVLILSVGVSINALPLDPIQLNLAVQVINACFAPAVLCVLYILASATEEDYAHISFRPEVGEREKRARRRAQYSGAGNNGYAHSNEDNSEDNNSIPNSEGCAGVGGDGSDNASHMHIHQRHGKKLFMRRVLAADQIGDSGHNANDSGDNDGNSYNNNVDSYYHPQSPSFSQPFLSQSHTRAHPEHSLFRQRHHYHHHHLHRCRYVLPEAFRLQGLYKCVVAFVFTLCSVVGLYSAGMGVYHQAVGGQG